MAITRVNIRKVPTKKGGKFKVYVGTHPQDGRTQRAFREKYGKPIGACVKSRLKGKKGLSIRQVWEIVEACARGAK